MKAFQIDGYGGAEVLVLRDVVAPVLTNGQVLVRVHATSFNPIDKLLASGAMKDDAPLKFPWTPGADFSGVVEAVGDGVEDTNVGDEVYGFSSIGGCYAELLAIDSAAVGPKPRSLNHVEAASLALVGQTAKLAVDTSGIASGQTILIHGAAGAVGSVAVQLAHGLGAHVIATGTADSDSYLKGLGADEVIDYKATPFENVAKDVDAVLDTIGGDTQERSFKVLKQGGTLVALNQPPSEALAKQYHVQVVMLDTKSTRAKLEEIAAKVDAGDIKTNVGRVFPLSDVPTVWKELSTLHISGKIVFTV